jgi:hypothetical protein
VVDADRRLAAQLERLSRRRIVVFAGLPGTGKSLLVHQLAHLAAGAGRTVHLLQWDVARPVFEATPAGLRYPLADGVTHAVIRKAAGLWARQALVDWHRGHPDGRHLLVGEAPFVGGRFVELGRPLDDDAEPLLAGPSCRFALAVPSADVRRFLEALRGQRAVRPLHPREREDAPPHVLRDLWRELAAVAARLGVTRPGTRPGRRAATACAGSAAIPARQAADTERPAAVGPAHPGRQRDVDRGAPDVDDAPYDPATYQRVYEVVLRHRHRDIVPIDVILPTERLSVYDFAERLPDLVPTAADAERSIREVEERYADAAALDAEIARWWET